MARRFARQTQPIQDEGAWHLDKRIPLSLIGTILAQTFVAGVWASGVASDISQLKTNYEMTRTELREKAKEVQHVAELEIEVRNVKDTVSRIEAAIQRALDKLEERLNDRRSSRDSGATPRLTQPYRR